MLRYSSGLLAFVVCIASLPGQGPGPDAKLLPGDWIWSESRNGLDTTIVLTFTAKGKGFSSIIKVVNNLDPDSPSTTVLFGAGTWTLDKDQIKARYVLKNSADKVVGKREMTYRLMQVPGEAPVIIQKTDAGDRLFRMK
jgi:hypothetical protein